MTAETVTCKGRTHALNDETYWHAAPPRGTSLYHNAFIHEGFVATISLLNAIPETKDALSPYSFKAQNDPKEQIWERVRKEVNANLPSRNGAMFLTGDEAEAKALAAKWFPNENRNILKTRVIKGSAIIRVDAHWLDCQQDEGAWEANALNYWTGERTADPTLEYLVHGSVYFPDWKEKPFGHFAGLLPGH
jgi:hypothetical protein